MSYREHPPPRELAPWLECTWERVGDGAPVRVLPDGCIDVVWTEGARTLLVGPHTTAFIVPVPPGVRVAGARLHPGAAGALLEIPAEALRDARVGVEDAWRADGARLAGALNDTRDPMSMLRSWLIVRRERATAPDALVREAVRLLARSSPSIPELAARLSVSERQLRRRVTAAVGYGPKLLERVFRLHRALEAARAGDELAQVAFAAGYADQAHFANECRALAGAPASVVLAS